MLVEGKRKIFGIPAGKKILEAGQSVRLNNEGIHTQRRLTVKSDRVIIDYVSRLSDTAGSYSITGQEMMYRKKLTSGRIIKKTYTERH